MIKMPKEREARPLEGEINKIYIERHLREAGFIMKSHHFHPYFELAYFEHGSCRFFIENDMHDLHAGDCLLIPPQVFHYTNYLFGACKKNGVYFRQNEIDSNVQELMPQGYEFFNEMRILQIPEAHREQIVSVLSGMEMEQRINDACTEILLDGKLQELLLLCSRYGTVLNDTPANIHTTDRQIILAARFVSEHYAEPVTAADIAAAAGFSPNYLSRKFREAAGIGLHEYLVLTRLQHAALELVSTKDSITNIAFRCGFSDSNYFKDAFRKRYGVTPREYRKSH